MGTIPAKGGYWRSRKKYRLDISNLVAEMPLARRAGM